MSECIGLGGRSEVCEKTEGWGEKMSRNIRIITIRMRYDRIQRVAALGDVRLTG